MSAAGDADTNDALVRSFLEAWERRDFESVLARWADDGVYHAMPLAPIVGKAAFREFAEGFAGVPSPRIEIRNQVASGATVINERVDHLTFRGRELVVPICAVFDIRDGLIAAWREYFDAGIFARP